MGDEPSTEHLRFLHFVHDVLTGVGHYFRVGELLHEGNEELTVGTSGLVRMAEL